MKNMLLVFCALLLFLTSCVEDGQFKVLDQNGNLVPIPENPSSFEELNKQMNVIYNTNRLNPIFYIAFWDINLSGTLQISSDNNSYPVINSGCTYSSTGYTFGTSKFVTIPQSVTCLDFTSENFTIVMWLYPTNSGTEDYIIGAGQSNVKGYYYRVNENGSLTFVTCEPTAKVSTSTAGDVSFNTFHMYSVIRNGTNISFYKDISLLTNSASGTHNTITTATINRILGKRWDTGTNPYHGLIGEIIVFDRVLSISEITYLYNLSSWRYQQ